MKDDYIMLPNVEWDIDTFRRSYLERSNEQSRFEDSVHSKKTVGLETRELLRDQLDKLPARDAPLEMYIAMVEDRSARIYFVIQTFSMH